MSKPGNLAVRVPETHLEQFKQLSKAIFKSIDTHCEVKVPIRKGLDLLSQAYGYTSHPDLVRQAPGYSPGKEFDLLPISVIPVISAAISINDPELEPHIVENCLIAARALFSSPPVVSVDKFINELPTNRYYTEFSKDLRFHFNNSDTHQVKEFISSLDHSAISDRDFQDLIRLAVKEDYLEEVQLLFKIRPKAFFLADYEAHDWRAMSPLYIGIINKSNKSIMFLLDIGCDLNKAQPNGRDLVSEAIDNSLHNFLEYAIDKGLIYPNEEYLLESISNSSRKVFQQILRISSTGAIRKAIELSLLDLSSLGAVHYLIIMYPDIISSSEVLNSMQRGCNLDNTSIYQALYWFTNLYGKDVDPLTLTTMASSAIDPSSAFNEIFFSESALYPRALNKLNIVEIANKIPLIEIVRGTRLLTALNDNSADELLGTLYEAALTDRCNSHLFFGLINYPCPVHFKDLNNVTVYGYSHVWKLAMIKSSVERDIHPEVVKKFIGSVGLAGNPEALKLLQYEYDYDELVDDLIALN